MLLSVRKLRTPYGAGGLLEKKNTENQKFRGFLEENQLKCKSADWKQSSKQKETGQRLLTAHTQTRSPVLTHTHKYTAPLYPSNGIMALYKFCIIIIIIIITHHFEFTDRFPNYFTHEDQRYRR